MQGGYGNDDNGSEGPTGTFEIYKAEADTLFRQGDYKKAIEGYTTALEIRPGDKTCLVARSKCHLQLGDTKTALEDAQSSLGADGEFHKGIYQKAEAFYYKGDFEMALVFYHRGNKLRPELKDFRLGIQKAQEAIDNSVGSPEKVRLTTKGDLSFFTEQDEKQKKRRPAFAGGFAKQQQQKQQKAKRVVNSTSSEKTIKQLLGEMYGDRKYLEKLLKETDNSTSTGRTIYDLVEGGLVYLDTRTDFWRQQKPMYARKYESMLQRRRRSVTDTAAGAKGLSPNDYIMNELEKIDAAQGQGKYSLSLKRAQKCLKTVDNYSNDAVPNKLEVIANLHSYIGNAYLELGQYKKALFHHGTDLELGQEVPIDDAKSRGLDNLGRVHARMGSFEKAVEVWEQKLPMSKTPLECTWLYHEIGRCHLELQHYDKAKEFGEKSLSAAEEANDTVWQLQASVLIAQSEVKLGDFQAALASFEKSLDFAKLQEDESAENAIKKAMDDVNNKIVLSLKGESTADKSASDTDTSKPASDTDTSKPSSNTDTSKPGSVTDTSKHVSITDTSKHVSITDTSKHVSITDTSKPASVTDTSKPASVTDTSKPVTKTDSKTERGNVAVSKADPVPASKSGSKTETSDTESKPASKSASKTESQTEAAKSGSKTESKTESKPESKPNSRSGSKLDASVTESKPAADTEVKEGGET